jgi:hypothetical protein
VSELQVHGVVDPSIPGNRGRRGGAGPSDHRALTIAGTTVMVPVYNAVAQASPYRLVSDWRRQPGVAERRRTPCP